VKFIFHPESCETPNNFSESLNNVVSFPEKEAHPDMDLLTLLKFLVMKEGVRVSDISHRLYARFS